MSEWLQAFDRYWIGEEEHLGPPSAEAVEAVRHMGTNSLPMMLRMLAQRDSRITHAASWASAKQSLFTFHFCDARTIQHRAAVAFVVLGEDARPAMSRLVELLADDDTAGLAAASLSGIGLSAVPPLSEAVHSQSEIIRRSAVRGLGLIRPASQTVIASLTEALADESRLVRIEAVYALARKKSEADQVRPVLIETARDRDPAIASAAIRSLGDFASSAASRP